MIEKLSCAHIDADDKVVAITDSACYIYRYNVNNPEKLLKKLERAQKINTEHWIVEFRYKT